MKKNNLDKFYTSFKDIEYILNYFEKIIEKFEIIIEPSAGDGRFLKELKKKFKNKQIIGFDISPDLEFKNFFKEDFLQLNIEKYLKNYNKNKVIIIGNPPFGKNNQLALKFIYKSFKISNNVIFILSSAFLKERYQKLLNKQNIFIKDYIKLKENLFEIKNGRLKLNTYAFYLVKDKNSVNNNTNNNIINTNYLKFTKNKDKAIIAIRRVGGLAGKVLKKDIQKYSLSSNYFIEYIDNNLLDFLEKNFEKLNNIAKEKTLTNPSISKKELIMFISKYFYNKK